MKQELLPCPFCNEKPIKAWDDSYAFCDTIDCPIKGLRMPIIKWNTRFDAPNVDGLEDHDAETSALARELCNREWVEKINKQIEYWDKINGMGGLVSILQTLLPGKEGK